MVIFAGDFLLMTPMAETIMMSLSLNTLGFLLVDTEEDGAVAWCVVVGFPAAFLSNNTVPPPCCCKGSTGSAKTDAADWTAGFFIGFSLVEGGREVGVAGKVEVAGFMAGAAPRRRFASLSSW